MGDITGGERRDSFIRLLKNLFLPSLLNNPSITDRNEINGI